MNWADWLLLAGLAAGIVFALRRVWRNRKKGGCFGCSGCCGTCEQSSACKAKGKEPSHR